MTGRELTSSPGRICLTATTCNRGSISLDVSPPARGNTTTALGSQEWLIRATDGATQAPSGLSVGVVAVNVFVVN